MGSDVRTARAARHAVLAEGLRHRARRRWSPVVALLLVASCLALTLRPTATPAEAAPAAPDFVLPFAANGQGDLSLRHLRGSPVLLNFFNTHCAPCIAEMPALRHLSRAYRSRGLVVLGVATGGDTIEGARSFALAQHLSYPVVVDVHQSVAWRYNVGGWPTSFFLDAQGHIRGQVIGPLDALAVRDGLAQAGVLSCSQCARVAVPTLQQVDAGAARLDADVLFTPPRQAAAYALRDQKGAIVSPARLRGRVVALTFISALCKEQCPLVGQALSEVARQLGPEAKRLSIVAVSVDPEQDTAPATRAFAHEAGWNGLDWHYLTASRHDLARVWKGYWVYVPAPPPIFRPGQEIVHQAQVFLIDPRGRLRAYYDVPFLAPRVAESVRALLHA